MHGAFFPVTRFSGSPVLRILCVAAASILAACDPSATNTMQAGNVADVNGAAVAAQGAIDRYAAATPRPRGLPATTTPPPTPGPPPPTLAASVERNAEDAARVVRDYYDALAARRFDRAFRMWDDNGAASGMDARHFADSSARYAGYAAEIGKPGRVEAGAGQRFVEVPVRVTGTLTTTGRPFVLEGVLTLHRTTAVDGATAAQRSWRISEASLRPRPDEAAVVMTPREPDPT